MSEDVFMNSRRVPMLEEDQARLSKYLDDMIFEIHKPGESIGEPDEYRFGCLCIIRNELNRLWYIDGLIAQIGRRGE